MADIKAEMRRFFDEVVNAHDVDAIDGLVAPNFVEHEEMPGMPPGVEGAKQFFSMMFQAFPDVHFELHDLIAEGDRAVSRSTMTGTHKGTFMDIPATGKRVEVQVIDIVRFDGDKAAEHWGVTDNAAMMQQLGLMPE